MRETFEADVVVIGAGAVGLAIAATLARAGREVLVLEKNRHYGEETSSRNSEVIHAGLYYEAGSLKGRMCIEGRDRLYEWCGMRGVSTWNCGKLVVAATEADEPGLERVLAKAAANGMHDLEPIDGAQARAMEPALTATAALWSPKTGVVDSHGFMASLLGEAEDHGGALALAAPLEGGALVAGADGARVELWIGGESPCALRARTVINSAGLWAQDVSRLIEGVPSQAVPPRVLYKGSYYSLSGRAPFTRLIYPTPQAGGLGVHLTLDMAGAARFGPDVEPLDSDDPRDIDYSVDPARAADFYEAIRRYWPALADGALQPDYSGVRPKVDADRAADFKVDGPEAHGAPGYIALYGVESPGLTASLALANYVAERVADDA